jgi:hypothetical protein
MTAESVTVLYHRTANEAAEQILAGGFGDGEGTYMTSNWYRGVWLSDRPLDVDEGEEGKPYREWLIPAKTVNRLAIMIDREGDAQADWP